MQIQHLIDGTAVRSAEYFETVNPATQEVLAEVARGGEKEIDAAVAAAKAAFPAWAALPAGGRAVLLHRLGDLIANHVPEIARTETRDTGQVIEERLRRAARGDGGANVCVAQREAPLDVRKRGHSGSSASAS